MVAPTLISCPPEADVTSVIPIASIASSEALSRIVMILPEIAISPALFGAYFIAKNEGSAIRLNSTSISSAANGMNIWFLTALLRKARILFPLAVSSVFMSFFTSCDRFHYLGLVKVGTRKFACSLSVTHYY